MRRGFVGGVVPCVELVARLDSIVWGAHSRIDVEIRHPCQLHVKGPMTLRLSWLYRVGSLRVLGHC